MIHRWWRTSLTAACLLATANAYVGSPAVSATLRQLLRSQLARHSHLPVHLDAAQAQLLPPALVLQGLRLGGGAPGSAALLQLQSARLQPRLWPSRHGALSLQRLAVVGLRLNSCAHRPSGRVAPAGPQPWRLPVDLRHVDIADAQLQLCLGGTRWRSQASSLQIRPLPGNRRQVSLQVQDLQLPGAALPRQAWAQAWLQPPASAAPRPALTLSLQLEAQLQGGFDQPTALQLAPASLQLPGLLLTVRGPVPLPAQPASSAADPKPLQLQLQANLAQLSRPLPLRLPLAGDLHGRGSLRLQGLQAPQLRGQLDVADLHVGGQSLGRLQLAAQGRRGGINVEALSLDQGAAGRLTASGTCAWHAGGPQLHAVGRLHAVALPELLRSLQVPEAWLLGQLDGDVQVDGSLAPLDVQASVHCRGRNLAVLHHSYRRPLPQAAVLQLPQASLHSSLRLQPGQVDFASLQIATPHSALSGHGSLSAGRLLLLLRGRALHLAALSPIAGVGLGGEADLDARVEGPLRQLQVSAPVQLRQLRLFGYSLGDGSTHITYRRPQLRFGQLRLLAPAPQPAWVVGDLRFLLAPQPTQMRARLQAHDLSLAAALRVLRPQTELPAQLRAPLRGSMQLDGPPAQLRGRLQLHAPSLHLGSSMLGRLDLNAQWDGQASVGMLQVRSPRGTLGLHGSRHRQAPWHLTLAAHRAPLQLLALVAPQTRPSGEVDGHLHLQGRPEALAGVLRATGRGVHLYDVDLGRVQLDGDSAAGLLQLRGVLRQSDDGTGAVPLRGSLSLRPPLPYSLQAALQGFVADWLTAAVPGLQLRLDGQISASGALGQADRLRAAIDLQRGRLQRGLLALDLQQPSRLSLAHGRLQIGRSCWAGKHAQACLGGNLTPGGSLDLRLDAGGDMAIVDAFLAPSLTAQGPFSLHLQAQGPTQMPQLRGWAQLQEVTLLNPESQQSLDHVSAKLTFAGRDLVLQDGRGELGGGVLRFFGEASLPRAAPPQVNLRADLRRLAFHNLGALSASLSGDLQLLGPTDNLLLRGSLKADSARYSPRLDLLDKLIPRRDRLPLPTLASPGRPRLRYLVHLRAPNNVVVNSPVVEAELQADLTLTGTLDRPGLLGSLTPLWARAHYRDNAFEVVRATIDFVDEYRIFTEYQLQARTRACNMIAEVTINGSSEGYTLIPFGQDDRGTVDPQDVLTCLQFGLRLHDFEGNQRAPASLSDALPGSLDALWTVSGLDTKVKKILPIDVDELRLTSGWSSLSQRTTARVLVGKDLGDGVMLKYSRSLDEYNDQAVSLEYRLGQRATLQGNWLTARDVPLGDFGIDLRLHWELR